MTIGLINLYSARNLGDAAIYSALASMCPGERISGVLPDCTPGEVPGLELASALPRCDAYISVGGEVFNNARPRLVTRRFLNNLGELRIAPRRTMSFGQTIPRSCQGLSQVALAMAMRQLASVTVRDEGSYRLLRAYGVDAQLSYDTAFVLRPSSAGIAAAVRLYDRLDLDPARAAVISLRGRSLMYQQTGASSERRIADLVMALQRRGHQVAVVLQADADEADSDRALSEQLAAEIPGLVVIDPFREPPEVPRWQLLISALALANLVVAVRYHTAILRLAAGRSALVLDYSSKGADLRRRLRLPGMALLDADAGEAVAAVERLGGVPFDPEPLTRDVRERFADGLAATGIAAPAAPMPLQGSVGELSLAGSGR